jgi:uncharacterized membrane protein YeaQ/YmgE (transglycosylase-associated protein family)
MSRSKLEWILIAGFLLFHFLFLFIEINSSIFLGLSSLFYILLTIQYMVLSQSVMHFLAFGLNAGTVIGINMKLEYYPGAQAVMIAGMVGYILIALILTFSAQGNKQRINSYAFLPYGITGLMIALVILSSFPNLAEYSSFLNYPILLFSGQILLSRVSRGQELRGFYCALMLVLLSSGISVLDQTISSL